MVSYDTRFIDVDGEYHHDSDIYTISYKIIKEGYIMRNLLLTSTFFVIDSWRSVMDNRYSPLRHIHDPSIQGYFTMALFTMWSGYFGVVAIYYLGWLSYSIVTSIWVHLAVIIPILITNGVFREAEKSGATWHTEFREKQNMGKDTEKRLLQVANLAPSEELIEKIVETHPMKQIAVMSVVQVVVLVFMGVSMYVIGVLFK